MQQTTDLPLDEQAITLLAERTEGWAAGLRLAAFTLTTHDDIRGHLAELPADNRYVMDYLMGEVLSHIPTATQDFLLKTSILDRLSGPFCDAVTGTTAAQWNGRAYLERLAQENLFTWSIDPHQQWYRCHHLFRKLLQVKLEQRYGPEEIAKLHMRASAWLAGNGFVDEAIEHSLTAGDVAEAVRLVETHRHAAMDQERWPDLQRWLSRLPRQVIDAQPGLVLAEAWLLHHQASLADVSACLARAGVLLQQTPLGEATRLGLQGEIDALTSQLVYWTADAERTLALTQRALATTPIEHAYVRALARLFAAAALQMRGDIRGRSRPLMRACEKPGSTVIPMRPVCWSLCSTFIGWPPTSCISCRRQIICSSWRASAILRKAWIGLITSRAAPTTSRTTWKPPRAISRQWCRNTGPPTASFFSIARSGWHRRIRLRAWSSRRAPPPQRRSSTHWR